MRLRRSTTVVILALALGVSACAARGPRAQAQVSALALTDLAVDISRAEQTVYEASVAGYDKAAHDTVGRGILKVLYATRGYERAAGAWPEGAPKPEHVTQAGLALGLALDDLTKVLPAIAAVRDPLNRAIAALRAALAGLQVDASTTPVLPAQLPPGGILGMLALVQVLGKLFTDGRTTVARFREWLAREGATAEDFAKADATISEEIAIREAEHADRPPEVV
jgi:hypothetical protein